MSSIYINDVAYNHIIDTSFSKSSIVSIPEWINSAPEIDTNVWSKKPLVIIYTLRITDAEKWALDQLLIAHQKIYIEDDIYIIDADVWIRSINAKWKGDIDWSNPWLLEIELVIVNMLEGDYSTWTEKWQWDFPEGLEDTTDLAITFGPDYIYILYEDDSGSTRPRFVILNIADASSKFLSSSAINYQSSEPHNSYARTFCYNSLVSLLGGGASFSIRGKYVLILRSGSETFEVWKDGVLVFTSPVVGDVVTGETDWGVGLIRYDGKYIIISTYPSHKLVCFEGS